MRHYVFIIHRLVASKIMLNWYETVCNRKFKPKIMACVWRNPRCSVLIQYFGFSPGLNRKKIFFWIFSPLHFFYKIFLYYLITNNFRVFDISLLDIISILGRGPFQTVIFHFLEKNKKIPISSFKKNIWIFLKWLLIFPSRTLVQNEIIFSKKILRFEIELTPILNFIFTFYTWYKNYWK